MADVRLERFKEDIAAMRIKDPSAGREALLLRAGGTLMVAGLAVAVAAYFLSHSTFSVADQNDDQVIALAGVAATIVGAALFLRYSLGALLRFWLARLVYEQRLQTDRLLTGNGADTVDNI